MPKRHKCAIRNETNSADICCLSASICENKTIVPQIDEKFVKCGMEKLDLLLNVMNDYWK